jgi:hypothetical protein
MPSGVTTGTQIIHFFVIVTCASAVGGVGRPPDCFSAESTPH